MLQLIVRLLRSSTICSAFPPDSRYDNGLINPIGYVYCPSTTCPDILCVHKNSFQSLDKSDYQCPQCEIMCQVRIFPFEEQTKSFFLKFGLRTYLFEETKKSFQGVIEDV